MSFARIYLVMLWPLRDGPHYREYGPVAFVGDDLLDPHVLHVELLPRPELAPHLRAQAHDQVRRSLDEYLWQVALHDFELWPEMVHQCRSSGHWYSALPWCARRPHPTGLRPLAEPADPSAPPIPAHCPRCATPTIHDDVRRVFRCPACAWHD